MGIKKLRRVLIIGFLLINRVYAHPSATRFFEAHRSSENACLRCHGNTPPIMNIPGTKKSPMLPQHFSMKWNMYEVESGKAPPFAVIPSPHRVNRGETHYDWTERKMIEVYENHCINIFPSGNDFSCKFISDHGKTYFITYELGDLNKPRSCCLWSQSDFWAPRPDVLLNMSFQKSLAIDGENVDFWIYDIPLPGPFGYGTVEGTSQSVAFWFPVIGGWVQQNFFNFSRNKPDAEVFALPAVCRDKLKVCDRD